MKSKHISLTIMAVMLIAAFVLGACILITPAASADTSTFSAENAATYLKVISSKPHSVFDAEAHEEVRQYLKNTLTDMGLTVEEHDWNKEDLDFTGARNEDGTLDKTKPIEYDIHNLWVTIPGKSETGMLLMAHYDSRGHTNPERDEGGSYGAADDGFGVVTLLEIARLYASVPKEQLETSLYFCFTDAEETGMFGAKLEARDNQIVKDHVNFVMNVEARGVRGPAFMFETSKKNEKVMELYAKAKLPATYSVATAVYSVMTNFTDFTAMLDIGKAGVNFSTLDNINYYHVPEDNFSNISKDSIQHYGEQIVPMIEEYTSSAKYADMNYFNGEKDAVFFNILPGVLARYSEDTAIYLTALGVLLYVVALAVAFRAGKLKAKRMLAALAIVLGAIVLAAALGFGISYLTALIVGNPWNLTYLRVPSAGVPFAVSFAVVFILELVFCFKKFKKNTTAAADFLAAGLGLNIVLAALTTFTLSGASFLFFWPAFIGSAALVVWASVQNFALRHVFFSLANIITMLIYVPLLYALFLAVTIGGLLALNLLFAFALSVILPVCFLQGGLRTKKDAVNA